MKKILALFILFSTCLSIAAAETPVADISPWGFGPFVGFKGGINGVNTPSGRKNSFSFSSIPDFGLTLRYYINHSTKLGFNFDAAYSTYSYNISDSRIDSIEGLEYKHTYSYFTLNPSFSFDVLYLGFALGIPVSANYGADISTSNLKIMTEVFAGVALPVIKDSTGCLSVNFKAGYMLSHIFKDYEQNDPLKEIIPVMPPQKLTDEFNPRAVSFTIGIKYLLYL